MADEKSPMRISHRLLAINRSEMRIGMENIVSKLIMYGDMPADSILMKLCDVSKRAKDMDAPKDELVIEASFSTDMFSMMFGSMSPSEPL